MYKFMCMKSRRSSSEKRRSGENPLRLLSTFIELNRVVTGTVIPSALDQLREQRRARCSLL